MYEATFIHYSLFIFYKYTCSVALHSAPIEIVPSIIRYVSTTGDDDNAGTESAPMATFQKALTSIPFSASADVYAVIYFQEGTYYPTQGLQQSTE